jgi:protein-tyrosine phosphatase
VSAERIVPFEACFNFRDLGGYDTVDGRSTAWGRLYRSDALYRMTPGDVERMALLGIQTVFDLRAQHELDEDGAVPVGLDVTHVHVPMIDVVRRPTPTEPPAESVVSGAAYVRLLESGRGAVREMFELLAEPDRIPAVFHCAAGKDRTGIVAALVLAAVGVSEPAIVEDYVLTQSTRARSDEWIRINEPATAARTALYPPAAREARPDTMVDFLEAVRDRHGSVVTLLADVGITESVLSAVRTNLLAP